MGWVVWTIELIGSFIHIWELNRRLVLLWFALLWTRLLCNRLGPLKRGGDDGIYCVLIFGILPKASGLWRNNKTLLTATLIWCHVQRFAGHRFHNEAAFMSR